MTEKDERWHATTLMVATGHNPAAVSEVVDAAVLAALTEVECKILYRDAGGRHAEEHLGRGLRRSTMRGTYCAMHLECAAPALPRHLTPACLDAACIDRLNLYVSPPRAGAPLHFDTRWAVVVQLAGGKLWQVADGPAVSNPNRNVVADEVAGSAPYGNGRLSLPDRMRFVYLRPGDWLLVPRATWHGTFSWSGSVSATLAFGENVVPDLSRLNKDPACVVPPAGVRRLC